MADTKQQLRDYIVENFLFGDTETEFADSDSFMEKGIIDSTGILEVITYVEDTFDISVNDEEILPENLDSVENLSNFIKTKQSNGTRVAW